MITPDLAWRKSSYSGNGGTCVEIAWPAVDGMAVRDSKNTDGPTLEFGTAAWRAFLATQQR